MPPETFYYSKNENGFTSVVEIKELPYLEALERFGAGLDSGGNVVPPKTWSGSATSSGSTSRSTCST